MAVRYKVLSCIVLGFMLFVSGCSGQPNSSLPQEQPLAITQSQPSVASYGNDTDTPVNSDRAKLNCFVDSDRGDDFVVHGVFHLPSTSPEGQDIRTGRFQIVAPASEAVKEQLKGSVGKTVSLFGKFNASYGTGQGLFSPVSLKPSQGISPTPSWQGWGRVDSTQAGHFLKCVDSAALTDWVSSMSRLADALGLPNDAVDLSVSDFLAQAEEKKKIPIMKYKIQQLMSSWPLVYADGNALAELRSMSGQYGFITSANVLQDMLVRRVDINESQVDHFMEEARVAGDREGPHKKAPATIFGFLEKDKNTGTIYVVGVEGDTLTQWLDIFRGRFAGYQVAWRAVGVPELCSGYCWFAGYRVQDDKTKQWFFCVSRVLPATRYNMLMGVLSALQK